MCFKDHIKYVNISAMIRVVRLFFYPFDLFIANEFMPAGTFPVCHIQISISEPSKPLISSTLGCGVSHHEGRILSTNKRAPNDENAAHFSVLTFTVKTHKIHNAQMHRIEPPPPKTSIKMTFETKCVQRALI